MTQVVCIKPVTRLEGHAKLNVQFDDSGIFQKVAFGTYEPPRGFERIFVGMPGEEVPRFAAKICGICSSAYNVAGVQAIENAWEFEPPEAAKKLRELMLLCNLLQSHTLHVVMLALPDFLFQEPKMKSIVGLLTKDPEAANAAIKLRDIGQKITEIIGGRQIHAATVVPGGMTKPLDKNELERIRAYVAEARACVQAVKSLVEKLLDANEELFKNFGHIESSFLCMRQKHHLTLCDADLELLSKDGQVTVINPQTYARLVKEHVVEHSFTKQPYLEGTAGEDGLIRVGPLARINRCDWRSPLLTKFDRIFRRPSQSTLAYNIARVIELEEALRRIEEILDSGIDKHVRERVRPKAGRGVGIVEAPRGVLFHQYSTDRDGTVTEARIIAPTTQNALAIEKSADAAARQLLAGKKCEDVIRDDLDRIEMVVRAYDPCVSCSVHMVQLEQEV